MQLGLLGYPLSHSFSKIYFEAKFKTLNLADYHYHLFEQQHLNTFFSNTVRGTIATQRFLLDGFNVTIPHKTAILPFLDSLAPIALTVGAVNTVVRQGSTYRGYNTDVIGFENSFLAALDRQDAVAQHYTHYFILGNGGASKAVQFVFNKLGIAYQIVSRVPTMYRPTIGIDYAAFNHILSKRDAYYRVCIINTTPLGSFPNINEYPNVEYNHLRAADFLYDLIYNPETTIFLAQGAMRNCFTLNGLAMLHGQAEAAWRIWHYKPA